MTFAFERRIHENILKLNDFDLIKYLKGNYLTIINNYINKNNVKLFINLFYDNYYCHCNKINNNINIILCHVDYLRIEKFKNITHITKFTQLSQLTLYDCKNIKDISFCNKLQELNLNKNIYGIHVLKLLICLHVTDYENNNKMSCNISKQIFKLNKYKINKINKSILYRFNYDCSVKSCDVSYEFILKI